MMFTGFEIPGARRVTRTVYDPGDLAAEPTVPVRVQLAPHGIRMGPPAVTVAEDQGWLVRVLVLIRGEEREWLAGRLTYEAACALYARAEVWLAGMDLLNEAGLPSMGFRLQVFPVEPDTDEEEG